MNRFSEYLKKIDKALAVGNATEHTHRPALKYLFDSLEKNIEATNEPKRVKCGAPDFIVVRGETPIGYIETKDIGKSLDAAEREDQLKRYRAFLGNLILTDYLEFRWYVGGEHRLIAKLATVDPKRKLKLQKEGVKEVSALIDAFIHAGAILINNPKELAIRMAAYGRHIHDTILRAFDDEDGGGELRKQMEGFKQVLLHDLTEEQFADMYAQTICYGLFAARCHHSRSSGDFVRELAAYELPKTNPFLRRMFSHIAGPDLDDRIVWIVEDLSTLLKHADMEAILQDFGKRTRKEDPVVHFYETFLSAYDPKMRAARGVYYTPEPVVSYITRSIDLILKKNFGLSRGLADSSRIAVRSEKDKEEKEIHKVLILDPATGTGTFLYSVINLIYESFAKDKGMWSGYVSEHLLPRLFGLELLMAPYAVAHMKLGLQLAETGYDFGADERLRIYLTNTLEEAYKLSGLPLFAQWLAEEANAAGDVKKEVPVMVILGNPPYSVTSLNKGFETDVKTHYYPKDGMKEANPKVLLDDYVKFIRFAQQRIEQTGYGILAFITNHGYLDNPTFRGMRKNLMDTFDDIYILDLHGNSKKKEKCPDGSKDENVFDIQQGVAIGIFIKRSDAEKITASVNHAHLWGLREIKEKKKQGETEITGGKYYWLAHNNLDTTSWTMLLPQSPFYLFVSQDVSLLKEYEKGWKVTDLFNKFSDGIVTARDALTVKLSTDEIWDAVIDFANINPDNAREKYQLGNDTRDWTVASAQADLKSTVLSKNKIVKINYRPFDIRFTYYTGTTCGFQSMPRNAIMQHFIGLGNIGLVATRQVTSLNFCHVFCSKYIMEKKAGSHDRATTLFPLYIYPKDLPLLNADDQQGLATNRRPNLAPAFISDFEVRLKMSFILDGKGDRINNFGPEDVFHYMYAVFHSPAYRSRYAEFLKIDFPRLPLTSNAGLFRELCKIGEEFVGLHLLEKEIPLITHYPISGTDTIETVRYTEPGEGTEEGRVWINKTQYFEGVPPKVWNFHVGGYQVCQKWLKDRKGRTLSYDDEMYYRRVIAVIAETIRLMAAVDETIKAHGDWPKAFVT